MIDNFSIFTRGGLVLWSSSTSQIKGNPINDLIQNVLLEEKSAQTSYQHGNYTLKWTFSNQFDLIFVAVYLNLTRLLYIDDLLEAVKNKFCEMFQNRLSQPSCSKFAFDDAYEKIVDRFESESRNQSRKPRVFLSQSKGAKESQTSSQDEEEEKDNASDADNQSSSEQSFEIPPHLKGVERLKYVQQMRKNKPKNCSKPAHPSRKGKVMTKWDDSAATKEEAAALNRSKDASPDAIVAVVKREFGEVPENAQYVDEPLESDADDTEEEQNIESKNSSASKTSSIWGFFNNLVGGKPLTQQDLQPILDKFREGLMSKNVAAEIAEKLCENVGKSLEGKKTESFTTVKATVKQALEEALVRILTPKKNIDILQDITKAQEMGRPYSIVFVGVNGVGKSTSLSKVAAYFLSHGFKVGIGACDTFRSGAVEQLRTHCMALGIPLYQKGYDKDAASVAADAIASAKRDSLDVVLIDTAGRMQDNEPLMRALAKLINVNKPDLVLFVGEALVGNDAVDQVTKFNQSLSDFSNAAVPRLIDGIILTKFDTIDDKVGAAISMVYSTGKPIVFVGTGQTYRDLRKLNVKSIVKSLLK